MRIKTKYDIGETVRREFSGGGGRTVVIERARCGIEGVDFKEEV